MINNESLTIVSDRFSNTYKSQKTKNSKKGTGQFFTPPSIAKYMASLSECNKEEITILDPGAGFGILSVALIEKLYTNGKVKKVNLVCYETDTQIIPHLKNVLEEVKKAIEKKISFTYSIISDDFVQLNSKSISLNLNTFNSSNKILFDIIISNPPYFKLNKKDIQMYDFKEIISGQPNIYFLFMAISAKLLDTNGEMIFITPRSFCSGLYYNKFRKWLIKQVNFSNIHLFESRKELFSNEKVLQENIITRFTKSKQDKIIISKTEISEFSDKKEIVVDQNDVIYKSNGYIFFRIPSNEYELKIIKTLDTLPFNFYKLGMKISTGKVVMFRNRQFLQKTINKDSVPLLLMHNIKNGKIEWPIIKNNKPIAIINNANTKSLLQQADNYVILRRFTSKEQKKRFETACIYKEDFERYGYFALDNMTNYIYYPKHQLNKNQIKGIVKYLDLSIVDQYFRILNGHTQVNANEVYALPFPSLEELEKIGNDNNNLEVSIIDNVNLVPNLNTNTEIHV